MPDTFGTYVSITLILLGDEDGFSCLAAWRIETGSVRSFDWAWLFVLLRDDLVVACGYGTQRDADDGGVYVRAHPCGGDCWATTIRLPAER